MKVRSPLRYPGGKSKQAQMILGYMPSGTVEYREAFAGGAGVYFGLTPNRVKKRWINDLNWHLVEVYKALRDRPDEFIKLCRSIPAAQDGEEEVSTKGNGKKYNKRLGKLFEEFKYNEEMDQALRYFFLNRTVWAGRVNYDPAFESRLYYSNPGGWNIVHKPGFLELVAEHIRGTELTSCHYRQLLEAPGENVWVYLDPPYVVDTKLSSKSKLYQYGFSWADHEEFVQACKLTDHHICISYDDVPEVRDWFRKDDGFHIFEHSWKYSGTSKQEKDTGKELLITNYEIEQDHYFDIFEDVKETGLVDAV